MKTVLIILMLFLSGCNILQPTALMRPPRLSAEQAEINDALENAIGTDKYSLKYPKTGQYRSAFIFQDIDNDLVDEAIAFYQLSSEETVTRMHILNKHDNQWKSAYQIAGPENDIDSIDFGYITSKDVPDIIIGWLNSVTNEHHLSIYSFEHGQVKTRFSDMYDQVFIGDFNLDQNSDILLLGRSLNSRVPTMRYIVGDKSVAQVKQQLPLNPNVSEFVGITFGRVYPGVNAVFIDERLPGNEIKTEVFSYINNSFEQLIVYSEDFDPQAIPLYDSTLRKTNILTNDVDNDSILEIPSSELLPGYDDTTNEEVIYLTHYNRYDEGALKIKTSAAVNETAGYMIKFPKKWIGNITIKKQLETGEWQFHVYEENAWELGPQLLRIRVYLQNDYQDKLEMENYRKIVEKGIFIYYSYIPEHEHELSITESELRSMFVLT